jgi:von Willebrand factor type A domain
LTKANPGWLALGASLTLHTAAAVAIWLPLARRIGHRHDLPLIVDTIVEAPEVQVDLGERPRQKPHAAPKPEPIKRVAGSETSGPAPIIHANWTDSEETTPRTTPTGGSLGSSSMRGSTGHGANQGPEPSVGTAGLGAPSFFNVGTRARSVVYVVDRSASMGLEGGLAAAKRELRASIEQLDPEVRFQVIAYNRYATPLPFASSKELVSATPENGRRAIDNIEELRAEGGTDHVKALKCALALEPEVIYLVTDADDLSDEQVRAVTAANHGRTAIHTIRVTRSTRASDGGSLEKLAIQNGGHYQVAVVGEP